MPIHEYRCPACGHIQEFLTLPGDCAPKCPACRTALGMEKIMSASSFLIKGFSAANGYNLPSESDVLTPEGYAKTPDKWGK